MALEKRVKNLEKEIEKRRPKKNINKLIAEAISTLPEDKKNKVIEIFEREVGKNGLSDEAIKEIASILEELTEEEREKFYSTFEQKYDW